jgi:hypothetical protein
MIGAAAFIDEAVRTHLKDVQFRRDVRRPPSREGVNRALKKAAIIGCHREEEWRCSLGHGHRPATSFACRVDQRREIRPRFSGAMHRGTDRPTAGGKTDHADTVGLDFEFGRVRTHHFDGPAPVSSGWWNLMDSPAC